MGIKLVEIIYSTTFIFDKYLLQASKGQTGIAFSIFDFDVLKI